MTIGDSPCKLLVDTGAALSILSSTFFDQLENKPTVLPFDYPLTAANGGDLEIVGMADLIFRLGDRIYDHRFIIAKLDEVQGILGMEFLEQYDVVIRVSQGKIVVADQSIELDQARSDICARVRLSTEIVIPPKSEMLASGYIDKGIPEQNVLVEPYKSLGAKGLMLCRSLVDPQSVKLSIMNVGDKPVTLLCDTAVANIEGVDDIKTFEGQGHSSNVNEEPKVPEHLACLFEKVSPTLTSEQKRKVKEFLVEFQDVFIGPDGKLGRSSIVKHTIDTGDTRPIKIPPRRLPIAQKELVERE